MLAAGGSATTDAGRAKHTEREFSSWQTGQRRRQNSRSYADGGGPYSMTILSVAPRPNVSGWYISSAFGGGTTKWPGVVARAW